MRMFRHGKCGREMFWVKSEKIVSINWTVDPPEYGKEQPIAIARINLEGGGFGKLLFYDEEDKKYFANFIKTYTNK